MLVNIFQTGGLTLGLTIVWALLATWFMIQAVKAHNSGGITQGTAATGWKPTEDSKKTPFHKIPQFWFAIVVTALYVIALMIVASDYRGA